MLEHHLEKAYNDLKKELGEAKVAYGLLYRAINDLSVEYGILPGAPNVFDDLKATLAAAKIALNDKKNAEKKKETLDIVICNLRTEISELKEQVRELNINLASREEEIFNKSEIIQKLEQKLTSQKQQISKHNTEMHIKNIELDALYYVWCNGGCKGGVLRYMPGKINQAIIDAAVNNTKRLVTWWNNHKLKECHTCNQLLIKHDDDGSCPKK